MTARPPSPGEGHTPGPWIIDANADGEPWVGHETRGVVAICPADQRHADMDTENHANARLIAAAPALLAACEAVLRVIEETNARIEPCADLDIIRRERGIALHVIAEKARAAVAQARQP